MAITHQESWDSRDVVRDNSGGSQEQTIVVSGDPGDIADEWAVTDYILNNVSPFLNGLPFSQITEVTRISDLFYKAKILYQSPDFGTSEEETQEGPEFSIDTTGGSTRVNYGLEVLESQGNPSQDIGAAINWDGQRLNGVDIVTPAFAFTQKVRIPDSQFTLEFMEQIYDLTGKVNLGSFLFFEPGDVLFLGATATKVVTFDDIEDEWDVTYKFSAIKTRENIEIGDYTVAKKRGYDYLWTQTEQVEDKGQKKLVPKAIASYVVKMYEEEGFALLGVGTV